MANDFDLFPLYDGLIKKDQEGKFTDKMANVWSDSLASFLQNLIGYLSQYGIFVPQVTTVQRNTIQSPQEGQMIYNTTIPAPQIYQNGSWKTFTTT